MRRFLFSLAAAATLAFCALPSRAAIPGPMQDEAVSITVSSAAFTDLAINVAKTTDPIFVQGWRFVTFQLDYTNSAASAVTMACSKAATSSGTYRPIQVLTVAGSTLNSDAAIWSQAVSGDEDWPWTVTFFGAYYLKCTFTATGGDASDTLTITATRGN